MKQIHFKGAIIQAKSFADAISPLNTQTKILIEKQAVQVFVDFCAFLAAKDSVKPFLSEDDLIAEPFKRRSRFREGMVFIFSCLCTQKDFNPDFD